MHGVHARLLEYLQVKEAKRVVHQYEGEINEGSSPANEACCRWLRLNYSFPLRICTPSSMQGNDNGPNQQLWESALDVKPLMNEADHAALGMWVSVVGVAKAWPSVFFLSTMRSHSVYIPPMPLCDSDFVTMNSIFLFLTRYNETVFPSFHLYTLFVSFHADLDRNCPHQAAFRGKRNEESDAPLRRGQNFCFECPRCN